MLAKYLCTASHGSRLSCSIPALLLGIFLPELFETLLFSLSQFAKMPYLPVHATPDILRFRVSSLGLLQRFGSSLRVLMGSPVLVLQTLQSLRQVFAPEFGASEIRLPEQIGDIRPEALELFEAPASSHGLREPRPQAPVSFLQVAVGLLGLFDICFRNGSTHVTPARLPETSWLKPRSEGQSLL